VLIPARVVLIPKPDRDPALTSSFRSISILPALSKIWEHTFKGLIKESLGLNPLHEDQNGFRRKRSTVNALCRVINLADWAKRRSRITVLVAVDVKNAFNTLSWSVILREADVRGIPKS
jgi:retron-type reverse transcriptase